MIFVVFFVGTLSLILGSTLSFLLKKSANNFILGLGFSAGIMLYMSLSGGFDLSVNMLENFYPTELANFYNTVLFCISMFFTFILDTLINKINIGDNNEAKLTLLNMDKLNFIRMFFFILIAITVHNISEALYLIHILKDNADNIYQYMTLSILHNIIEGIAMGFPIYYVIKNKTNAFLLSCIFSFFSMFSIFIIYIMIHTSIDLRLLSFLITLSSALMLYLVFMEILPFSQKYSINYNTTFLGIILGVFSMMSILNISPYLIKLFNFIY